MYAVARLVQDLGTRWRVIEVTPPVHDVHILAQAAAFAEDRMIDPRVIDAIYSYPRVPLTMMHAWWCSDKIIDVRPVEPVQSIRHYWLGLDGGVQTFEQARDIQRYRPALDAPMMLVEELEPYGSERPVALPGRSYPWQEDARTARPHPPG